MSGVLWYWRLAQDWIQRSEKDPKRHIVPKLPFRWYKWSVVESLISIHPAKVHIHCSWTIKIERINEGHNESNVVKKTGDIQTANKINNVQSDEKKQKTRARKPKNNAVQI